MKCCVCVCICIAKLVVNFNDFQENLPSFLSFLQLMGVESLRTRKSPEKNDVTNIKLSMSGFRKHPYPPPRRVIGKFKWEGDRSAKMFIRRQESKLEFLGGGAEGGGGGQNQKKHGGRGVRIFPRKLVTDRQTETDCEKQYILPTSCLIIWMRYSCEAFFCV